MDLPPFTTRCTDYTHKRGVWEALEFVSVVKYKKKPQASAQGFDLEASGVFQFHAEVLADNVAVQSHSVPDFGQRLLGILGIPYVDGLCVDHGANVPSVQASERYGTVTDLELAWWRSHDGIVSRGENRVNLEVSRNLH